MTEIFETSLSNPIISNTFLEPTTELAIFDDVSHLDFSTLEQQCLAFKNAQKIADIAQYSDTLNDEILAHFEQFKFPQNCVQNPTNLTNPYWQWVIQHRLNPNQILNVVPNADENLRNKRHFGETTPTCECPPLWSFQRMGQTQTMLPDGREIFIGGEFDDFYDPNFCIFNDVVVKYPNGDIQIFAYPENIFPPTDFHSAILIDGYIYIIGNMGYFNQRNYNSTPVYRLNIHSYKMEKIETRNHIGWLNQFKTSIKDGQIIITEGKVFDDDCSPMRENIDDWAFNPSTRTFQNLTNRHWQGFWLRRKDFDHLLTPRYWSAMLYEYLLDDDDIVNDELSRLKDFFGDKYQYDLYKSLFTPPMAHSEMILSQEHFDEVEIYVLDDIKIRYVFHFDYLQVYIQGQLDDNHLTLLQENLCHKMSKLENCPCEIKLLPFHTPFGVTKKVKRIKRI